MSSAIELRTWLNRPDRDFAANLAFAIKAWRSLEFVLITKHEIITAEFCRQLPQLRKELRKSADAAAIDRAWTQCCEFLSLKYAPGAISTAVKDQLVQALRTEARKSLQQPHGRLLDALLATLHHTGMQNFYKSSPAALADLIATVCSYQSRLLAEPAYGGSAEWLVQNAAALQKLFAGVLQFVKQTPLLVEFRQRFAIEAYVPLVELVVALRERGQNYSAEFFGIVQEMFFPAGAAQALREWLKKNTGGEQAGEQEQTKEGSEFRTMFAQPSHALALWLEAILIAFRLDSETQIALHRFLFGSQFKLAEATALAGDELLGRVTWYLGVLRRHDAQMMAKMDGHMVRYFLRPHVEALCEKYHTTNLEATLRLMCAAVRLEPMMLEHSMVPLAVKCMVLPKDEGAARRYAEYLELVIGVFRKLSHAAKFVSHLLRSLMECLAKTKLSSKTKRKSLAAAATPAKKAKSGEAEQMDVDEIGDDDASLAARYFAVLLADFDAAVSTPNSCPSAAADWPEIAFAWPAAVGNAFVQFIGALVSKTALIVWKNILFALTDYVTLLKEGHSDANTLFLVDTCAALFCQYFAGARLAEHTDRTWAQVEPVRALTHSLLHEFGKAVVGGGGQAHSDRTVRAFLKCCVQYGDFELLCFYYWPDTMPEGAEARAVHAYLERQDGETAALWQQVAGRVAEVGSAECRRQAQRLQLQRTYGEALLGNGSQTSDRIRIAKPEEVQLVCELLGAPAANELVARLEPAELRELCLALSNDGGDTPIASSVLRNPQFVFALSVSLFNRAFEHFGGSSVKPVDIGAVLRAIGTGEYASVLASLVARVERSAASSKAIKSPDAEAIVATIGRLRQLPTDFLDVQRRNVLFVLLLELLVAARRTPVASLSTDVLALLKRFVHFGAAPELFAVLPIEAWVRVVGGGGGAETDAVLPLYRSVFERSIGQTVAESTKVAFDRLLELLGEEQVADGLLDIGMVLVACLAREQRSKATFAAYAKVLLAAVVRHLGRLEGADREVVSAFVARTVAGFAVVLPAVLVKTKTDAEAVAAIDGGVQRACAVYLEHMQLAEQFGAGVKLLGVAMQSRAALAIGEEQLGELVKRYWAEYLRALRERPDAVAEHSEAFVRVVLNSKTSEEFIDWLEAEAEEEVAGGADVVEQWVGVKHRLFGHVAKCQLTKVKGSIFNEIFKQLALRIVLQLRHRASGPLHQHADAVCKLLAVQRRICTNIQLPVSVELVDDVLAFLGEIGIRQLAAAGATAGVQTAAEAAEHSARFVQLHAAMADVALALVQHRHFYVVDRVAQFGAIVRDLLHAVAFFRAGVVGKMGPSTTAAGVATATTTTTAATTVATIAQLDKGDVAGLAELSHRLENIVKSFVKHAKDVKRIAPYLLLSTIQLLVSDDQPTTNFGKIKTHFDFICFDLISICDHRVEGFVMRNCNEASKQVYEQLNRDFNKYHKFKGKV